MRRTFSAFEIDGQRYERVEEVAHERTNGTIAVLTVWRTACPDCQVVFTFAHPERPAPSRPRRRCPIHTEPSRRVVTALSADPVPKPVRVMPKQRTKHYAHELVAEVVLPAAAREASSDAHRMLRDVTQERTGRVVNPGASSPSPSTSRNDVFLDR